MDSVRFACLLRPHRPVQKPNTTSPSSPSSSLPSPPSFTHTESQYVSLFERGGYDLNNLNNYPFEEEWVRRDRIMSAACDDWWNKRMIGIETIPPWIQPPEELDD